MKKSKQRESFPERTSLRDCCERGRCSKCTAILWQQPPEEPWLLLMAMWWQSTLEMTPSKYISRGPQEDFLSFVFCIKCKKEENKNKTKQNKPCFALVSFRNPYHYCIWVFCFCFCFLFFRDILPPETKIDRSHPQVKQVVVSLFQMSYFFWPQLKVFG